MKANSNDSRSLDGIHREGDNRPGDDRRGYWRGTLWPGRDPEHGDRASLSANTALLLAGRSSDQAGRKPVLAFCILLAALWLFSLAGIWRALLPPGLPQAPDANDTSDTPSKTAHIPKEAKRRVLPA
jgi:hypothetical protein